MSEWTKFNEGDVNWQVEEEMEEEKEEESSSSKKDDLEPVLDLSLDLNVAENFGFSTDLQGYFLPLLQYG